MCQFCLSLWEPICNPLGQGSMFWQKITIYPLESTSSDQMKLYNPPILSLHFCPISFLGYFLKMITREQNKMMMGETTLGPNSKNLKIRNELSFWAIFYLLKDDFFGPPLSDFTMMMITPFNILYFKSVCKIGKREHLMPLTMPC